MKARGDRKGVSKISVIIPTLNEEKNIPLVLKRIPRYISEVIVVDGHSTDKTVAIAKSFGTRVLYDDIGKGSALVKGVRNAKGDIIITMDADCSNRIVEFDRLLRGIEQGFDICMGSRFIAGGGTADMPFIRRIGNSFFVFIVNLIWGTHYTDLCYGYRSFRKDAWNKMNLQSKRFAIETEISIKAAKCRLKTLEVPSYEKTRKYGRGKLSTFRDGANILSTILKEMLSK